MAEPRRPGDEQLDRWIRARLDLLGIDLDLLPDEDDDPETGVPSRATVLETTRAFLRETTPAIHDWRPDDDPAAQQQTAPPVLYPAPHQAWTGDER